LPSTSDIYAERLLSSRKVTIQYWLRNPGIWFSEIAAVIYGGSIQFEGLEYSLF